MANAFEYYNTFFLAVCFCVQEIDRDVSTTQNNFRLVVLHACNVKLSLVYFVGL